MKTATLVVGAVMFVLVVLGPVSVAVQVPVSVQTLDESMTLFAEARADSDVRGVITQERPGRRERVR